MKATPDQHDPDWPKYPETILHFAGAARVSIDLRAVLTADVVASLRRIGFDAPFAVMTAFDPRGENLSPEENEERARRLDARLGAMGIAFTRVDACSPDGEHCECSIAAMMPKDGAIALAIEFEQVAIFWFDGSQFWIVSALFAADALMLPQSS